MPLIHPAEMQISEPLPGWKGRFWRSQNMSFAYYDISAGPSIHEHHHPNEEVWTVIEGQLEVTIDGVTQLAGLGSVAVTPANVPHSVRAHTQVRWTSRVLVVDPRATAAMSGRAPQRSRPRVDESIRTAERH